MHNEEPVPVKQKGPFCPRVRGYFCFACVDVDSPPPPRQLISEKPGRRLFSNPLSVVQDVRHWAQNNT